MASHDTNPEDYRWYYCMEHVNKRVNSYECIQVSAGDALGKTKYPVNQRTFAVPIPAWLPTAVDCIFIKRALKPSYRIVRNGGH